MNIATVTAAIIAVVEAVKRQAPQINGIITVLLAIGLGAIVGYFHIMGLDLQTGVAAGLAAVGVHTAASAMGSSN